MTVTIQEIIDEPIKNSRAKIDGNFSALKTNVDLSDAHIESTSNPHSVTKTQVGLGNVDNTSDANKPVSTAQAIAIGAKEPANANIQAHIGSTTNPHSVTAAQVGAEPANANIQSHISSTANPHTVTATQVGNATAQWNADKIKGIEVDTTGIADTNVLKYDQATGKLIAGAASVVADLNDLDDVVAPTPIAGDALKYDGANWVNEAIGGTSVINNEVPTGLVNSSNTVYTTAHDFVASKIAIYLNRTRLKLDEDYTETGTNEVTLTVAPTTGDDIWVDYVRSDTVLIGDTSYQRVNETPAGLVNGSNTVFTTAEPYIAGTLQVFLNGQLQAITIQYAETDSTTITFVTAPLTDDVIKVTYQTALTPAGNADTLDGAHLSTITDSIATKLTTPGEWVSFTGISSGITIGSGISYAYYNQIGKTVHFTISVSLAADSSVTGTITLNLPTAAVTRTNSAWTFHVFGRDGGTNNYVGLCRLTSGATTFTILTAGANTTWNATVPFTWSTADTFSVSGTYESI